MPILTAHNVHKTYALGKVKVPVLRGVNLSVEPGTFVAILGASGSGKSTLLHILGGLDDPDRTPVSRVEFNALSIPNLSSAQLDNYRRSSVGFVFQFYHLLPELNVLQNVTIAAMARLGLRAFSQKSVFETKARDLLESFGLGHRLTHRPAELSGGERQRVAIARALINDPPLLLADEPTGNLDRATGAAILDLLIGHRQKTGRTLVMVTHDAEIAARADKVVRIVDGRIAS